MADMSRFDRLTTLWKRAGLNRGWCEQRGSILLFTTVAVVPLMIIMAGLAMDIGFLGIVDAKLQKAMDAAALAGAGKLGWDDSVFPTVRQTARDYATRNPYHNPSGGIITLDLNDNNLPGGDIVLGTWNAGTFRPFTPLTPPDNDPSRVNAVRCQTTSQNLRIPTSFLRLIGLDSVAVAAQATAISNPPSTIPPDACMFPIGVSQCPFRDADGNFGAHGCGQPVSTFKSANTNSATWVSINGTDPASATQTRDAINQLASGVGCTGSSLDAGESTNASGGEKQSVIDQAIARCTGKGCEGNFVDKFNSPTVYTVKDARGNLTYQGHGWEVFVPVVRFDCDNTDNGEGDREILTWTRLVITQVISHGDCTVANHYPGNVWDALCPAPNGTATAKNADPNFSGIFGYYECKPFEGVPPVANDAPRAALATRLRLVQ
jgi:hypothetical protein